MSEREQKITFDEMRESGVRSVVIYCADYRCAHSTTALADGWPDDTRLSDIEGLFVCKACGRRRQAVDSPARRRGRRCQFLDISPCSPVTNPQLAVDTPHKSK
jgi:hypothetical protein